MGTASDLRARGPLVLGRLFPEAGALASMLREGRTPDPAAVELMVDTGAEVSAVGLGVARALGLEERDFTLIRGATQHDLRVPVFEAELALWFEGDGPPRDVRVPLRLAGLPLADGGTHQGFLGRDFLEELDLHYLGPDGRFELALR